MECCQTQDVLSVNLHANVLSKYKLSMALHWSRLQSAKEGVTMQLIVHISTGLMSDGTTDATTLLKHVALKLAAYKFYTTDLDLQAHFDTKDTRLRVFITRQRIAPDSDFKQTIKIQAAQLTRNLDSGGYIEVALLD